jgi:hypothetical protein
METQNTVQVVHGAKTETELIQRRASFDVKSQEIWRTTPSSLAYIEHLLGELKREIRELLHRSFSTNYWLLAVSAHQIRLVRHLRNRSGLLNTDLCFIEHMQSSNMNWVGMNRAAWTEQPQFAICGHLSGSIKTVASHRVQISIASAWTEQPQFAICRRLSGSIKTVASHNSSNVNCFTVNRVATICHLRAS